MKEGATCIFRAQPFIVDDEVCRKWARVFAMRGHVQEITSRDDDVRSSMVEPSGGMIRQMFRAKAGELVRKASIQICL